MAGRGPAPKPKNQRQRRNEPARGEWVDLDPITEPVLPDLPDRVDPWNPRTIEVWEAWKRDPVTQMWSPADIQFAIDCIYLYDAGKAGMVAEVRRRMDSLGLTPKGKRDLRWRIKGEHEEDEEKPAGPQKRRHLRAV